MSNASDQTQQLEIRVLRAHLRVPIVFLLPLFMLISMYCALYLGVNADWTRRALPGWLNQGLGAGEYQVTELVVGPDLTTADVYGAEIRVEGADRPTITAQHAHASIQPLQLVDGRIIFDESHAVDGHVRLVMDESGHLNLLRALGLAEESDEPESEDAEGVSVEFPNLSAENCSFEYVQPYFDFSVPRVDVPAASLSISKRGHLSIDVPRLKVPESNFRFRAEMFGFEPADWGDWEFTASETRVTQWQWRGDGFAVDRVQTYADGISVDASGSMGFPSTEAQTGADDATTMTYDGEASVEVRRWSSLAQYFLQDTVHADVPDLRVAAKGTLDEIDGGVDLHADRLLASGVELTDLDANLRLQNQYVTLADGSASMYGGRVRVPSAYFDIYRVAYGGDAEFSGVNPARVISEFGGRIRALRGSLDGEASVHGAVPFYDGPSGDDELPLVTFANRELVDATVTEEWSFEPAPTTGWPEEGFTIESGATCLVDFDRVALDDLGVRLPGGRMQVHQAELDYERMIFTSPTRSPPVLVTASLADPVPLSEGLLGLPIGGEASLRMSARGPVTTPSGHLVAQIDKPSAPVRGRRVQGASAQLDLFLEDGLLRIREAYFDSDLGSVRVDGRAELYEKVDTFVGELWRARQRQPLNLSMEVDDLDLGAINALFDLERGLSGFLTASIGVGGTVQSPQMGGQIELPSGTVYDATVSDVALRFGLDSRHVSIDHTSFGLGGGRVTGSGSYRWGDGTYEMDLGVRGIQLGALVPLDELTGRYAPSGRLDANVAGKGSLREPALGGSITLRDATVGQWPLGDTALAVYAGESSIHISGAAVSLATIDVEIPVAEAGPVHAQLGLNHLELGERFPEVRRLEAVNRLGLTGEIEVFAARDLSTYNVVTHLERLTVRTSARTFRNKGPLVMSINHRGVVQFEEFSIGSGGEFVQLKGGVRLDPLLLDLRMTGQLDLRLMDVVGPYLIGDAYVQSVGRVEGRVLVDATFRGVPSRPIADGRVTVETATIHLRDVSEPVLVRGGEVQLSRQEIRIVEEEPVRGEVLGGTYRVTGKMGLDRFRPTSARLEVWSHNLQYRLEDTANITFDTDVELTAEDVFRPQTYRVSGAIDVIDGQYYRDMSLVNQQITGRVIDAFSGRTERYQANPLSQMPWLTKIAFDLQIRARDGFLVQSRVDRFQLDLELRTDVNLQETLNDPRVTGEVKVIDGAVGFQGELFEVSQGTLTFRGTLENPLVDLRAGSDITNRCVDTRQVDTMSTSLSFAGDFDEQRQSTYHILLNAEGPLKNIDIGLESNPYADQRDILSLMLTGCTVDELTASSASQPTLEIALGPLLGRIEKQVKDVVELSEFSIMPGVERTELRIGDEVTRRLRWNFQLDTGLSERAGGQRYQLEYRLSERWSAEFSERSLNETDNLLLDVRLKYRVPIGQ